MYKNSIIIQFCILREMWQFWWHFHLGCMEVFFVMTTVTCKVNNINVMINYFIAVSHFGTVKRTSVAQNVVHILIYQLHCCVQYPRLQSSWGQHGPIWSRQDPGGPHVGPMNLAIRDYVIINHVIMEPDPIHHSDWPWNTIWLCTT